MKPLLLILLLPLSTLAQEVNPVISKDYLDLIKDTAILKKFLIDTTNNVSQAFLKVNGVYNVYSIGKIRIKHGYLKIEPATTKALLINGSFNSTIEIKRINHLPALQREFVQGRAVDGSLSWQGPETDELFSYGPHINTLEYDGSNYAYDVNGKLVLAGSGNGQKATGYNNSIFRTANLLSQSLVLQTKYIAKGNQYVTRIKLGQTHENTFIKDNKNTSQNFSAAFESKIGKYNTSVNYNRIEDGFSNSNRNGFLNRLYQNSILTPISFDNSQGSDLGNTQRSYSQAADNPYFLLDNNGNSFLQTHKTASLVIEKKGNLRFKIAQSAERLKENSIEAYKPGTAFFQNGIIANRQKTDANYFLNANANYDIRYGGYSFNSVLTVNYIYCNSGSSIDYRTSLYKYQRSSNDLSLNYLTTYQGDDLDAGIRLENKTYTSNTSLSNDFFLPGISGYLQFNGIFNSLWTLRFVSSFNNFNSELPISTSFSQNSLAQYSTEQAIQFFPITEAKTFDNLFPIQHKEWTGRIELNHRNKFLLQAEVFSRRVIDDVFPVNENGIVNLKNIASHRNRGVELELSYNNICNKNVSISNSLSFVSYKNIVTAVKDGYDFTPIAGFSNINKVLVKNEALGVIAGNKYLRDGNNNVVVGNDGFPLVDNKKSVIGDPTPDFIMKLTNRLGWKKFDLSIDLEWKKGGDMWNGTQAVLDYYGRSQRSALLRNVTNYIFPGTLQDGHSNNIPVNFYDPNLPLEKNRWVRYGYSGTGEEYIQKSGWLKINSIGLSYKLRFRKYIQQLAFTLYANNIIIAAAYKGADASQLLFDQDGTNGLDFFNLPSLKTFGFNVSIQF